MKLVRMLLVAAVMASPAAAGDRLDVRVSPIAAVAPAEILIVSTVERQADNAALEVEAESEDFYRSSVVQLRGEASPRITSTSFSHLPAGVFEVRVRVLAGDGRVLASATRWVRVS